MAGRCIFFITFKAIPYFNLADINQIFRAFGEATRISGFVRFVGKMSGLKKYEIGVYNQEVRQCVNLGERHRKYDHTWDDADARRMAEKKFPASDGFVIDLIQEMKEYD
jgi:hypothetical protein